MINPIKKEYKAILFDMDGTLVPMNMDEFTSGYFKLLAKKLVKHGIPTDTLVSGIWSGTGAMVKNDGSKTNKEVFWDTFAKMTGVSEEVIGEDCEDFYGNEFKEAICFTQENPLAVEAVELAHKIAPTVVLATNPLFPMAGQITRMNWVGLRPEMFDLITAYEKEIYCKPNPNYYASICERLQLDPKECLMIGNDETEDAYAASQLGMDVFIVTDCIIPSKDHPWEGEKGSFEELVGRLKEFTCD